MGHQRLMTHEFESNSGPQSIHEDVDVLVLKYLYLYMDNEQTHEDSVGP